jgi:hypothetical protein
MSVLQDFLLLMICQVSKMKEILSSVNSVMQGCTKPRHQVTWATNCVWWHLIFVGPQYVTCFMSTLWHSIFVDPPQNCIKLPAF